MIKPQGYDELQINFTKKMILPPDGYVCRIKNVEECESQRGTLQIRVQIDIAEGDYYAYWRNKWEEKLVDNRHAGYPKGGTIYISLYKNGNESEGINSTFKAFCEAYKESNSIEVNWTATNWGNQFEGKYIGAVYRHRESEYKGHIYMQPEVAFWTSVDTIRNKTFKVPPTKYLQKPEEEYVADGFNAVEDDIPF